MDPEKQARLNLIELLSTDFACEQEINVRPALFPRRRLRADVVAISLDHQFFDQPIAFEVKCPTLDRKNHYAELAPAIKQASDYVYAAIDDPRLQQFNGRRIIAAFVYPSPPWLIEQHGADDRESRLQMITSGAFHLGLHLRVGRASKETKKGQAELVLSMGAKQIWSNSCGWDSQARQFLSNKRKLGSQQVDVLSELDGTGQRDDGPMWE